MVEAIPVDNDNYIYPLNVTTCIFNNDYKYKFGKDGRADADTDKDSTIFTQK